MLSTLAIDLAELPEKVAKKLPRHPNPAALIGRLAVDISAQGKGIGRLLVSDAIKRNLAISDEIAIYAIVVDAIDKEAESFFLQYGFAQLASESRRLYLPLQPL